MHVLLSLPKWDWCQMPNIPRILEHGTPEAVVTHDQGQAGPGMEVSQPHLNMKGDTMVAIYDM